MTKNCPLCNHQVRKLSFTFKDRIFYHCSQCQLISVSENNLPTAEVEKSRYLLHQNDSQNEGYLHFLEQLWGPLQSFLQHGDVGLDYGCGPDPVLANLIITAGHYCDIYDPFFFPVLQDKQYDFITATECFEHFHYPSADINIICKHLKPQGILGIMTNTWCHLDTFPRWHYIRDLTHVSFYHNKTIDWIAKTYQLKLLYTDDQRVFILQKN